MSTIKTFTDQIVAAAAALALSLVLISGTVDAPVASDANPAAVLA